MNIICKDDCIAGTGTLTGRGWVLFTSILVILMPKCAFCWAAYMSILSSLGIMINYKPWFLPVCLVLFLITLIKLLVTDIRRKNFVSFVLALLAGLLIVSQRSVSGMDSTKIVAIALMAVAVLRNNFFILYRALGPQMKNGQGNGATKPGFIHL